MVLCCFEGPRILREYDELSEIVPENLAGMFAFEEGARRQCFQKQCYMAAVKHSV